MNVTKWLLKICLFAWVCYGALPSALAAKPLKIVFFYPGGQGSQEQAKPLLDEFSAALKKVSGGDVQTEILYISDPSEGERYIENQNPAGGILSHDIYLKKASDWNAEIIAQTLQLPSGDGKNQYFLVGNSSQTSGQGKLKVFTSLPMDESYLRNKLFPNLTRAMEWVVTENLLGKLRKVGQGNEIAWVLLDQFEYATISRLSAPWAKNLSTQASSEKVPSAPFVIFRNNIPSQKIKPLQDALLKLSQDPSAQEVLPLLRLKGFQKP